MYAKNRVTILGTVLKYKHGEGLSMDNKTTKNTVNLGQVITEHSI